MLILNNSKMKDKYINAKINYIYLTIFLFLFLLTIDFIIHSIVFMFKIQNN